MLLTTEQNYLFCGLHIYLDKESKIIIGQAGNFCNRSICPVIHKNVCICRSFASRLVMTHRLVPLLF
jgi:hypothetical protein